MIPQFISFIDRKLPFIRKTIMACRSARVFRNYYMRRQEVRDYYERKFGVPRMLYIECTNVCNARCFFCAYPEIVGDIKPRVMEPEFFERILGEYSGMGGESISLTPTLGEPLVDKYFTERIGIIDRSPIKHMHFYTNLINYNDDIGKALESAKNTDVRVFVSFMGFDRESYRKFMGVDRFDAVHDNLRAVSGLPKKNPHISVRVKVQDYRGSGNARKDFLGMLDGLGIPYNIGRRLDTWGGLVEDKVSAESSVDLKVRQVRLGPCKISYAKPVVTVDHKLKLCDCRDIKDELVIGDLDGNSLRELWSGGRARELRDSMYDEDAMPPVCRKCELYTSIYDTKPSKMEE